MSSPADERALRRMVVNLAAMHADDAAAVLDDLEPEQRKSVERLLGEFLGLASAGANPAAASFDARRFSPWLADRLDGRGDMTDHARAALAACARELYPALSAPPARGKPSGFLKRLISRAS